MNYKILGTLKKGKKYIKLYIILWLFLTIVLIMPISAGITETSMLEKFDFGECLTNITKYFTKPLSSFPVVFSKGYFLNFINLLWKVSFIYIIIALIGFFRNVPKNEYEDIEHGSSDWSKNGEQYKVLNDKKGIILAEDNYLPVDKRGNVNVLVVGRIW